MKNLLLVAFMGLVLSCQSKKKELTTIQLDIKNIPAQKILLSNIDGKTRPVTIDSVAFKGNGVITFKTNLKEPSFLQIVFERDVNMGKFIPIVANGDEITIKGDYADLKKLSITGSTATTELWTLLRKAEEDNATIARIGTSLDSIGLKKGNDSLKTVYQKQIEEAMESSFQYKTNFARKATNPVLALLGIQTLSSMEEFMRAKPLMDSLKTKHATSTFFNNSYESYTSAITPKQKQPASDAMKPMPAQEISLPDATGKIVTLSSFKGKYVLVDFWASWCGPCRGENPNVVAAFNKFKNKNFTILGVSLDEDKAKWVEAVAKDKLNWTQISDLKGWQSKAAQDYGIQSIPANFLIDPNGTIIASDLRGAALEEKLAAVLK